jgi:SAM-dependent methyltransferase
MTSPYTIQDHLGFYLQHSISPVRQDISDLSRHLQRRGNLYRSLGMNELAFAGSRVLEVGPGSGHNSLLVASWLPDALDLLEPNPTGRAGIEQLYEGFQLPHTQPNVVPETLQDFAPDELYDIAIAEAWIGGTPDELKLMQKMASLVRPGGVLITTVTSPISMLANTFRRILGDLLIVGIDDINEQTRVLDEAFGSHLNTMADMSRPHEDWIQDSLLNPGFLTSSLTIEKFFDCIGGGATFHNSYPRVHTDWRWYKSLYGEQAQFNERFIESYYKECHNLYDFRTTLKPRTIEHNKQLEACSERLVTLVADSWNKSTLPPSDDVLECTHKIREAIAHTSEEWAESVDDFIALYSKDGLTAADCDAAIHLKPIFGRELLYMAMQRHS